MVSLLKTFTNAQEKTFFAFIIVLTDFINFVNGKAESRMFIKNIKLTNWGHFNFFVQFDLI